MPQTVSPTVPVAASHLDDQFTRVDSYLLRLLGLTLIACLVQWLAAVLLV